MLNVSKWVKIPFLIDREEMEALFSVLPPFSFYDVQRVTKKGEGIIPPADFLNIYGEYIEKLKRGEIPHSLPAPVLSLTPDALYAMPIEEGRQLYRPILPVIQMQGHAIRYSVEDHSFRSQLFGLGGILWGIQLGYPQIYEDSHTHAIHSTKELPNGSLFREIQKWIRHHTRPTPFVAQGRRQNVPIRLGKTCFSWINAHPQLKSEGIFVESGRETYTC